MGAMTDTGCQVIDFALAKARRPKVVSRALLAPKKHPKFIPKYAKGKLSRAVQLVPKRGDGKKCVFKKSCSGACCSQTRKNEPYSEFNQTTKERLRKEIAYWEKALGFIRHSRKKGKILHRIDTKQLKDKLSYVRQLRRVLQGISIPQPDMLKRKNSLCNIREREGEEIGTPLQHFTNAQMREVFAGINLELDFDGAYFSFLDGMPSGMRGDFADLLTEIYNLSYPKDSRALDLLVRNGGYNAPVCISRMVAEPTIPHQVRSGYVNALKTLVSCASLGEYGMEVYDELLARALSRFHVSSPGAVEIDPEVDEPKMPVRINQSNLRGMLKLSMEQMFCAIMDLSGMLGKLAQAPKKSREEYVPTIDSLYSSLKSLLRFALSRDLENKKMFQDACRSKAREFEGWNMESGEQFFVKHILGQMYPEDADPESVAALLEVLNAPEEYSLDYLKKLQIRD